MAAQVKPKKMESGRKKRELIEVIDLTGDQPVKRLMVSHDGGITRRLGSEAHQVVLFKRDKLLGIPGGDVIKKLPRTEDDAKPVREAVKEKTEGKDKDDTKVGASHVELSLENVGGLDWDKLEPVNYPGFTPEIAEMMAKKKEDEDFSLMAWARAIHVFCRAKHGSTETTMSRSERILQRCVQEIYSVEGIGLELEICKVREATPLKAMGTTNPTVRKFLKDEVKEVLGSFQSYLDSTKLDTVYKLLVASPAFPGDGVFKECRKVTFPPVTKRPGRMGRNK